MVSRCVSLPVCPSQKRVNQSEGGTVGYQCRDLLTKDAATPDVKAKLVAFHPFSEFSLSNYYIT